MRRGKGKQEGAAGTEKEELKWIKEKRSGFNTLDRHGSRKTEK